MGQTTYAGLITSDLAGVDHTRSIITTLDEQFSSSPSSNMQKIDKLFETQNNKITDLSNKQHIITIDATLQSSIDGTDYYIAESDDLTSYTDQMILLLNFDRENTGNVIININGIGDITLNKINDIGDQVVLVKRDIKLKNKYFVQYVNNKLILLESINYANKTDGFIKCASIYSEELKQHILTPKTQDLIFPEVFTVRFMATAGFKAGDKVALSGVEYTPAYTDSHSEVEAGVWQMDAEVILTCRTTDKKVFVGKAFENKADKVLVDWIPLTLNPDVIGENARYRKDGNFCVLDGRVKKSALGTVFGYLPKDVMPNRTVNILVPASISGASMFNATRLMINSQGTLSFHGAVDVNFFNSGGADISCIFSLT